MFVGSKYIAFVRLLFWLALAFALVMALLPHPPSLPIDSFGDKFEHMLAFSVLAILGAMGYPGMSLPALGERLSFLGALIEVCQSIPSLHRDCDIRDWMADTLAVIVALLLVRLVRNRQRTGVASNDLTDSERAARLP